RAFDGRTRHLPPPAAPDSYISRITRHNPQCLTTRSLQTTPPIPRPRGGRGPGGLHLQERARASLQGPNFEVRCRTRSTRRARVTLPPQAPSTPERIPSQSSGPASRDRSPCNVSVIYVTTPRAWASPPSLAAPPSTSLGHPSHTHAPLISNTVPRCAEPSPSPSSPSPSSPSPAPHPHPRRRTPARSTSSSARASRAGATARGRGDPRGSRGEGRGGETEHGERGTENGGRRMRG
ncbi:uncharacterized protein C8Q71DRAFT_358488, partial [Rhodofomes roseus]